MFSIVDFPWPEGPSTQTSCPRGTVRSTLSTAVTSSPDSRRKLRVTPRSSIAAVGACTSATTPAI